MRAIPVSRGRMERWACGAAIGLAVVLGATHGMRVATAMAVAEIPEVLGGLLLGALCADAVSGLVHWACDTWGDERTPWLGPTLIYAFREHHRHPRKMLEGHWTQVNREPGIAAALILTSISFPAAVSWLETVPGIYASVLAFLLYGASANQLHRWAHERRPPGPVRVAQRLGLVLSPRRHARHHQVPHTASYCISTGWLNPWLDRIDFWRRLERLVSQLTGATARAGGSTTRRFRST